MGDPNAIRGPAPSNLPKWLAKTHARYDADDVAFTPPEDGSHFFSLHLALPDEGSKAPLHKSTYDKINEELGYAENCAGGRRLSVGKINSPRRSSGLCLSAELQCHSQDQRIESITSDDQQKYAVKPLLVIPRVFSAGSASRSSASKQSHDESKFSTSACIPDSNNEQAPEFLVEEANVEKFKHSVDRANRTVHLGKDIREPKHEFKAEEGAYNIVDSVRNLFYGKSGNDDHKKLEVPSQALRKTSCPQFGQGVQHFKRDDTQYISSQGLILERSVPPCNSFFYRSSEAEVSKVGKESQTTASDIPESGLPTQQTSLSDAEREMAAEAAAAATAPSRVRRPRPSRLREMNFWAPTSM